MSQTDPGFHVLGAAVSVMAQLGNAGKNELLKLLISFKYYVISKNLNKIDARK